MSRAPARAKEIATRLAVGGSRAAIVRQLLIESVALSAAGCALGLIVGSFAIDWLKNLGAASFEVGHPIELDGRVMAVMAAIALSTSVAFGLAPAVRISGLDIRSVLVESGRGIAGRRDHLRGLLVAGEIGLSLVLLVSAGLLVRTLGYFQNLSAGFDPRNLVIGETSLLDARYKTIDAVTRLYSEGLGRIRAIPGVQSAAVALTLPYERPLNDGYRQLDGYRGATPEARGAEVIYVTPGYFETMAIPVLGGRAVRASDTRENARAIVVSESFARTVFGAAQEALGRHLAVDDRTPREIVGIAGDVQQHSGLDGGLGPLAVEPTIYLPVDQTSSDFLYGIHRWFSPKWVVRTSAAPSRIAPKIQNAVALVDPQLPISHFKTMDEISGLYLEQQRYTAALLSMLAALGLALAAIGLYGLISNAIAQRTHELGIRMALGASMGQIVAFTARPGILLALGGIGAGALLARAAARLIRSLLWGVQPGDPITFAATAAMLLVISVAASLIPCLRILRLDPARTLHSE
jgi:predicted permease